jgi:4,5-dihydroxyphthalate decarboxylase
MPKMRLTLIGEQYDCVRPLFDGSVQPEGVAIAVTRSPSPQAMRRQLTAWEFDICEMAFGAFLMARAQGADVMAIPVFPRRAFFHTHFIRHANAAVEDPADLAGKRVGIPEYVQSATLWARGVLEHDFGIDASRLHWYAERAGADSTGAVLGFRPPAGITIEQTPAGRSLVSMLVAQALDAALVHNFSQVLDDGQYGGALRPLFPDVVAEGRRFYAKHGYVPANHCYMIRGELVRTHPSLAADLCQAFVKAEAVARSALPRDVPPGTLFGTHAFARSCEALPGDALAYGIGPNRAMLETVVALSQEQGLVRERASVDSLFAPGLV